MMGVEPTRPYGHLFLRQARLPFRHTAALRVSCYRVMIISRNEIITCSQLRSHNNLIIMSPVTPLIYSVRGAIVLHLITI